MAARLDPAGVSAILLDIEGTTTPVDFVHSVLFPFARAHVEEFLLRCRERDDVRADLVSLREEHAAEGEDASRLPSLRDEPEEARLLSAVRYVHWLMDRDRKSTALKSLQGKIWEEGYRRGELRGQVYPDVAPALARWRRQGKEIAIFSSGSVLAQKLLFESSTAGDLTAFIGSYFDTTTGPKREEESYRRIAQTLGRPPSEILFLSDVAAELDAAAGAGMRTALCVRPGASETAAGEHPIVHTLDEVFT
ncbi:MAG: acireductone synthase [Vicinamibacteria bacterium]